MVSDGEGAAASLDDIARIERRTREALIYGGNSAFLILWGVLAALGFMLEYINPAWGLRQWVAVNAVAFGGTFVIVWRRRRARGHRVSDLRLVATLIALVVYGLVWSWLLGPLDGRQASAFWPTLFMFGYVVAGIWLGRFFVLCGLLVIALTLVGYRWLGPWFPLWMAALEGGALVAGGLWLRKIGVC